MPKNKARRQRCACALCNKKRGEEKDEKEKTMKISKLFHAHL